MPCRCCRAWRWRSLDLYSAHNWRAGGRTRNCYYLSANAHIRANALPSLRALPLYTYTNYACLTSRMPPVSYLCLLTTCLLAISQNRAGRQKDRQEGGWSPRLLHLTCHSPTCDCYAHLLCPAAPLVRPTCFHLPPLTSISLTALVFAGNLVWLGAGRQAAQHMGMGTTLHPPSSPIPYLLLYIHVCTHHITFTPRSGMKILLLLRLSVCHHCHLDLPPPFSPGSLPTSCHTTSPTAPVSPFLPAFFHGNCASYLPSTCLYLARKMHCAGRDMLNCPCPPPPYTLLPQQGLHTCLLPPFTPIILNTQTPHTAHALHITHAAHVLPLPRVLAAPPRRVRRALSARLLAPRHRERFIDRAAPRALARLASLCLLVRLPSRLIFHRLP